jgi:hypothetical protein
MPSSAGDLFKGAGALATATGAGAPIGAALGLLGTGLDMFSQYKEQGSLLDKYGQEKKTLQSDITALGEEEEAELGIFSEGVERQRSQAGFTAGVESEASTGRYGESVRKSNLAYGGAQESARAEEKEMRGTQTDYQMQGMRAGELAGISDIQKQFTEREDALLGQLGEIETAMAGAKSQRKGLLATGAMLMPALGAAKLWSQSGGKDK